VLTLANQHDVKALKENLDGLEDIEQKKLIADNV